MKTRTRTQKRINIYIAKHELKKLYKDMENKKSALGEWTASDSSLALNAAERTLETMTARQADLVTMIALRVNLSNDQ